MNDGPAAAETKLCPYCAETINAAAKTCKHCGQIIDPVMRDMQNMRANNAPNVYMNAGGGGGAFAGEAGYRRPIKSRTTAIILALLLGGIGAHKFYLGSPGWGILYLLFCWTGIPLVVALIEAIIYICTSEENFHRKYG